MITYKIFKNGGNNPFQEVTQVYTEDEVKDYIKNNMGITDPRLSFTPKNGFALKDDILVQKIETFLVHP